MMDLERLRREACCGSGAAFMELVRAWVRSGKLGRMIMSDTALGDSLMMELLDAALFDTHELYLGGHRSPCRSIITIEPGALLVTTWEDQKPYTMTLMGPDQPLPRLLRSVEPGKSAEGHALELIHHLEAFDLLVIPWHVPDHLKQVFSGCLYSVAPRPFFEHTHIIMNVAFETYLIDYRCDGWSCGRPPWVIERGDWMRVPFDCDPTPWTIRVTRQAFEATHD